MRHLIEITTDTHPDENREEEYERIHDYLLTGRASDEINAVIQQVRRFPGLIP